MPPRKEIYVWRRNDGFISSSTYLPGNWNVGTRNEVSFKLLNIFSEWGQEVEDFIARERFYEKHPEVRAVKNRLLGEGLSP